MVRHSDLFLAINAVIPGDMKMSAASEKEYEGVITLLDGGSRLTGSEVREIRSNIKFYDEQAAGEYAAGASCCEHS